MSQQDDRKGLLQIEQICQETLSYFIENIPLSKSNFPILQITYTLWRRNAYERIVKLFQKQGRIINSTQLRYFHDLSQTKYLPKYVQKLKRQMNSQCKWLKSVSQSFSEKQKLPKKQQLNFSLMLELGEQVWQQQLYVQLIQDLIRLPYLQIIPSKSQIRTKCQFETEYRIHRKSQAFVSKMANKAGKSIFNKFLSAMTETLFSKTFVLKINTLIGSFNPLVIGATFGLSQYMQYLDKQREHQQMEVSLKMAIKYANEKMQKIQKHYSNCLIQLAEIMRGAQENGFEDKKKQLKNTFLMVFEEEELQIQVLKDEEGWSNVKLIQNDTFQELTEQL